MHRGVIATAIAALWSAVLVGCSSASPSTDPTPPPTTPSVTVTSAPTTPPPTTPTTPTGPTIPPLARQQSLAGAKAFVRLYIDAINSSIDPDSNSIVRSYSTAGCITCRGIASSMDKIRRNQGFYRGGDWIVTSVTPIAHQPPSRPILHTAVTVTAGTWKRSPED